MRAVIATFALAAGLVLHGPFWGWSSSCCGSLSAPAALHDCCGEAEGGPPGCAASEAPCVDAHACNSHAAGARRVGGGVSAPGIAAAAPGARLGSHHVQPTPEAGIRKQGRARQPPPAVVSSLEYIVLLN